MVSWKRRRGGRRGGLVRLTRRARKTAISAPSCRRSRRQRHELRADRSGATRAFRRRFLPTAANCRSQGLTSDPCTERADDDPSVCAPAADRLLDPVGSRRQPARIASGRPPPIGVRVGAGCPARRARLTATNDSDSVNHAGTSVRLRAARDEPADAEPTTMSAKRSRRWYTKNGSSARDWAVGIPAGRSAQRRARDLRRPPDSEFAASSAIGCRS